MISQQFVWVPESSNDVLAYSSNELIEVLRQVIKPSHFEHNSFPSGRLFFAGTSPTYIDESLLYKTVNNMNLTEKGLWSFLMNYSTNNFDSIRFPGRGYIVRKSWSTNFPEWILYNRSTLRVSPNEMISFIPNLEYSLNNNSNSNALYNVTETGSVMPEMVHLIPDEIPKSIEVIRQGDLYWHRVHSVYDDMPPLIDMPPAPAPTPAPAHTPTPAPASSVLGMQAPRLVAPPPVTRKRSRSVLHNLLSVELPDNKSLIVSTTSSLIAKFLAIEYVISSSLFPLISSTDRLKASNDKRLYLETLSEENLKIQYTNYMNSARILYRNFYDLTGRIQFVENSRIVQLDDNDSMVLVI
jgi:hypothetical protein